MVGSKVPTVLVPIPYPLQHQGLPCPAIGARMRGGRRLRRRRRYLSNSGSFQGDRLLGQQEFRGTGAGRSARSLAPNYYQHGYDNEDRGNEAIKQELFRFFKLLFGLRLGLLHKSPFLLVRHLKDSPGNILRAGVYRFRPDNLRGPAPGFLLSSHVLVPPMLLGPGRSTASHPSPSPPRPFGRLCPSGGDCGVRQTLHVPGQVLDRHLVIGSHVPTLEHRPEALYPVGVRLPMNVLPDAVLHRLMVQEPLVGGSLVGVDPSRRLPYGPEQRLGSVALSVNATTSASTWFVFLSFMPTTADLPTAPRPHGVSCSRACSALSRRCRSRQPRPDQRSYRRHRSSIPESA